MILPALPPSMRATLSPIAASDGVDPVPMLIIWADRRTGKEMVRSDNEKRKENKKGNGHEHGKCEKLTIERR